MSQDRIIDDDATLEAERLRIEIDELRTELERWKIYARCVADRLREVTGAKAAAIADFAASCTEGPRE